MPPKVDHEREREGTILLGPLSGHWSWGTAQRAASHRAAAPHSHTVSERLLHISNQKFGCSSALILFSLSSSAYNGI